MDSCHLKNFLLHAQASLSASLKYGLSPSQENVPFKLQNHLNFYCTILFFQANYFPWVNKFKRRRGLVVRALDLQPIGPGWKSSSLSLDGFAFCSPELSFTTICK